MSDRADSLKCTRAVLERPVIRSGSGPRGAKVVARGCGV